MMSWSWMCWFWSLVGAGLLGWGLKGVVLRPWLEGKNREIDQLINKVDILKNQSPKVQTVERFVEVPVEKLVERVVDRLVDNPAHLARIAQLEGEVTVITALQQQIAELQAAPPLIIEKIVEVPVEKLVEKQVEIPVEIVVEKVVDRLVDNPAHLTRIAELEEELAMIADLRQQITELQATPPKIVEKIVENRVDVPVEIVVEKVVDRVVDNPVHVARIAELEREVVAVADLQRQIAQLRSAPQKTVETIVEKVVDRVVDNPAHLARLAELEGEMAVIADLQQQIAKLQAASPKKIEKIVEKHATVPEQKFVERTVYWDRTKGTQRPVKKTIAKGRTPTQSDDLKKIYGVGPVLERLLHKYGIFTFRQVAKWGKNDIEKLERQLPSFVGRIEREQWVRSATEEHYKKYKKWLGTGTPSITMPETR